MPPIIHVRLWLFIIRTAGRPSRCRPTRPLTGAALLLVEAVMAEPFTPAGWPLGFTQLPLS
jgi:hypothetical protein